MKNMFNNAATGSSTTLNLGDKFDTSHVTDMSGVFRSCSSLTGLVLGNLDTSQVRNMRGMFSGCSGLTSLDLSSFDTSQVTDMSYMFSYSKKLTNIYVGSGWQEASSHSGMFSGCGTDHVTLKQ